MSRRSALLIVLSCVFAILALAYPVLSGTAGTAARQPANPAPAPTPPLDAILGANAAVHWNLSGALEQEGGPYAIATDPVLGRPVLVAGVKPLTITSRMAYRNTDITCLVRLVTDEQRKAAARFCRVRLWRK